MQISRPNKSVTLNTIPYIAVLAVHFYRICGGIKNFIKLSIVGSDITLIRKLRNTADAENILYKQFGISNRLY